MNRWQLLWWAWWLLHRWPFLLRILVNTQGIAAGMPSVSGLRVDGDGEFLPDHQIGPDRAAVLVYLVATPLMFRKGGGTLWPLSELFATHRAAAERQRRLKPRFPACGVQVTALVFDLSGPKQVHEYAVFKRKLVAEGARHG